VFPYNSGGHKPDCTMYTLQAPYKIYGYNGYKFNAVTEKFRILYNKELVAVMEASFGHENCIKW
jgi:hypothetical protein